MIRLYIILVISCMGSVVSAQQITEADSLAALEEVMYEDTVSSNSVTGDTVLLIREINFPNQVNSLKEKKEFLYLKKLDSLLKAKQKQDNLAITNKEPGRNISLFDRFLNSTFLKIILWSIALVFIFLILYNFLLSKGVFKKPTTAVPVDEQSKYPDDFYDQDFSKLLNQSYRLGDYRMAVRYLFLKTLQQLNEKSMIELAADKTNRAYAAEIRSDLRNEFATLVLNYEYVWYGNIPISREIYERVEKRFTAFTGKI